MIDKQLAKQIFRFIIVGIINTGIDLVILYLLIGLSGGKGKDGIYYIVFKSISFVIALVNSYFMNKYWTFAGSRKQNEVVELSEFFIVSIIGFFINVGVATLVVKYIGHPESLAVYWPGFGALCGTAIGLVWNFFGYKLVVFKKSELPTIR
ncbi:MAG: putative rane protein [Candidatus Doudnabacteria bacterium]|nr:putative rane protein [Candidatus Doudnabacteria bacterium]